MFPAAPNLTLQGGNNPLGNLALQGGLPNVRGGLGLAQANAQGLQANTRGTFTAQSQAAAQAQLQQQLNSQFQARQGALGNANLANGVLGGNTAAAVAAGVRAGGGLGNMNNPQAGLTAIRPGVDRGNIGLNLGGGGVGQQNLGMQGYQLAALNNPTLQQNMNRLAGGISIAQGNLQLQQAQNARLQNMGGPLNVNIMQQGMPATNAQGQDLLSMLGARKQPGQGVIGADNAGAFAAAMMKQQQAQQAQQQGRGGPQGGPGQDFNVTNEDFPALPGAGAPRGGDDAGRGGYGGLQSNAAAALGRAGFMLGGDQYGAGGLGDVARAQANLSNIAEYEMLRYQQQQQQVAAAGAAAVAAAQQQQQRAGLGKPGGLLGGGMGGVGGPLGSMGDGVKAGVGGGGLDRLQPPLDKWGLLAIMPLLKMTEQDATTLELGINLTTLGLDLTSPSSLHKSLVTPLSAHPIKGEPEFDLPACYKHIPQRLQPGYLSKFKDETLFYIFYSMPGDEAQLVAADELSTRNWVFHKRLGMWMMPTPNQPPPQKGARGERGNYVVFNPTAWDLEPKQDLEVLYDDWEAPPRLPRAGPQQRPPQAIGGQQQPPPQQGPGGMQGAVGTGAPART